ncbi:uncharacterized protein BYT42DRAFT_580082 [Radiomyces spectabilis]|uniref:uncharacterized protein n=1 Tax=Radiomyces spectabilis TaxID=64574 RepID=UPI00221E56B9|nr:uncharacterized protein BYT42DRAFT_580082 [Radiomyces spectabilis]KAI8371393.1 hypothetical protein BYT42DRAFT_580082 [Radiomyces spectabilis]
MASYLYQDHHSTVSSTVSPCLSSSNDDIDFMLYNYLKPHYQRTESVYDPHVETIFTETSKGDDMFTTLRPDARVQLQLNTFSDLQSALRDIGHLEPVVEQEAARTDTPYYSLSQTGAKDPSSKRKKRRCHATWSTEEDLAHLHSTDFQVPSSVKLTIESSHMLESLMHRAVSHWCCIGFKVAPVSLDLIRNWHCAPPTIAYCVASISLVTFLDHDAGQSFVKEAAMVFYEQARQKMDDVLFDDMEPLIIQSYFCLSYTSNLLRLYEQQRTWGGLASIALQQRVRETANRGPMDESTMQCWFRWYYVDAWMSLTLNRECLLPDKAMIDITQPSHYRSPAVTTSFTSNPVSNNVYQFAALTQYMRRYIRAMQSGAIFAQHNGELQPSQDYWTITRELKDWYNRQLMVSSQRVPERTPSFCPGVDVHLHLCYNAVRLVVLYQFLQPHHPPPKDILIDCLETILAVFQALQHLKDIGCDQSTYHHMFFAIHNTAKRIYQYGDDDTTATFRAYARDQLRMNLVLLRGTQAYVNDVFKMRFYAARIEEQFQHLGIPLDGWSGYENGSDHHQAHTLPGTFVFRLQPLSHKSYTKQRSTKRNPLPATLPVHHSHPCNQLVGTW